MDTLAVLASGSGSNLQAILDAPIGAQVAVVIANRPEARALERARARGVPAVLVDHTAFGERAAFDHALAETLAAHGVRWVALAGFMRVVGTPLLERFPGHIVNVHPALLPAFPGLHAQRQALAAGARVAGCTVHLVDAGVDTGPILAQAALLVRDDDDERALSTRILTLEHVLFPAVLDALVRGPGVTLDGRVARWRGPLALTTAACQRVEGVGGLIGAPWRRVEG
jgi:phosphoribosylglycinamide formyltransferase-1